MKTTAKSFVPKKSKADVKFVWHAPAQELEDFYNFSNMRVHCANEELQAQHSIKKYYDKGPPHGHGEPRFHHPLQKGRVGNPPGI